MGVPTSELLLAAFIDSSHFFALSCGSASPVSFVFLCALEWRSLIKEDCNVVETWIYSR